MHFFIPGQKKHLLHKNLHKSETYSYTIDYVYNGDNITSEKWIYKMLPTSQPIPTTTNYPLIII
jgi:hypothetical protein